MNNNEYKIDALIKIEIREGDVSLTEKEILLIISIRLLQNIQISFNQQMNLFENIRNWIFLLIFGETLHSKDDFFVYSQNIFLDLFRLFPAFK